MDLALLVYGISVLGNLGAVSGAIVFLSIAAFVVSSIAFCDGYSDKPFWKRGVKVSGTVLIVFGTLLVVIPSEKTMYTMVGAYAAQKVAEDPKVQQLSGKVLKLVENKLDTYINESITPKK